MTANSRSYWKNVAITLIALTLVMILPAPAYAELGRREFLALFMSAASCEPEEQEEVSAFDEPLVLYQDALIRFGDGVTIPGGVSGSTGALKGCSTITHVGDSLSELPGLGSRLDKGYRSIDPALSYHAQSGAPLSGWGLTTIQRYARTGKNDCLIVELGSNDLYTKPGTSMESNIDSVMKAAGNAQILWVAPYIAKNKDKFTIDNFGAMHSMLKRKAASSDGHLHIADWYAEADPNKDFDHDPLHPNNRGYNHLANIILLSVGAQRGEAKEAKPIRLQMSSGRGILSPIDGKITEVDDHSITIQSEQSDDISMTFTDVTVSEKARASRGRTIKGGDVIAYPSGKNNTFVVEIKRNGTTISFDEYAGSKDHQGTPQNSLNDIHNDESNINPAQSSSRSTMSQHSGKVGSTQSESIVPGMPVMPGMASAPSYEQFDTWKIIYEVGKQMGAPELMMRTAFTEAFKESQYKNLYNQRRTDKDCSAPPYGTNSPRGSRAPSGAPLSDSAQDHFFTLQKKVDTLGIESCGDGNSIGVYQQQVDLTTSGDPAQLTTFTKENQSPWGDIKQTGNKVFSVWRFYYQGKKLGFFDHPMTQRAMGNAIQVSDVPDNSQWEPTGNAVYDYMKKNYGKLNTSYQSAIRGEVGKVSEGELGANTFNSEDSGTVDDLCDNAHNAIDNLMGIGRIRGGTLAERLKNVWSPGDMKHHVTPLPGAPVVWYRQNHNANIYEWNLPKDGAHTLYDCSSIVATATYHGLGVALADANGAPLSTQGYVARMKDSVIATGTADSVLKSMKDKLRPGDIFVVSNSPSGGTSNDGHTFQFVEENSFGDVGAVEEGGNRTYTYDEILANNGAQGDNWQHCWVFRPLNKRLPHEADHMGNEEEVAPGVRRDPKVIRLWKINQKW